MTRRLKARTLTASALVATAGVLCVAPPASAQRCLLGIDISFAADRLPSACEKVSVGDWVLPPVTTARDGAVWAVVRESRPGRGLGGVVEAVRYEDGHVTRVELTDDFKLILDGYDDAGHSGPRSPAFSGPAGADGVVVVAGDLAEIATRSGKTVAGRLPAPAVGRPVVFAGHVVVPTRDGLMRFGEAGLSKVPTADNLPTGDAAIAPGGTLVFVSGTRLVSVAPSGGVTVYDTGLYGIGPIAPLGSDDVWFGAGRYVLHTVPQRATTNPFLPPYPLLPEIQFPGRITGIHVDAGSPTLWVTGHHENPDGTPFPPSFVDRVAITRFPPGHPQGVPCDERNPFACGTHVKPVEIGDATVLTPDVAPEGITRGGDGLMYASTSRYLLAVRTYRGLLPCGKPGATVGPKNSYACQDGRWSGFVIPHPIAYARVSCLRLTFRYCAGAITLRYRGQDIGRSKIIVNPYDNPTARIPLKKSFYRRVLMRGGRTRDALVDATITSTDGGGLTSKVSTTLTLYPGRSDRNRTGPAILNGQALTVTPFPLVPSHGTTAFFVTNGAVAGATRYAWSFGDGASTSTTTTRTSHAYARPGTYHLTLTAHQGGATLETAERDVSVG